MIRGTAVNQDGRSAGLTAPSRQAQSALLREAYRNADVAFEEVGMIEAHGTGTSLGDPIEIEGLKLAFKTLNPESTKKGYCGLGSVKTNIGHLEPAAGIAGVIKVLLAMHNNKLPKIFFKK